MIKNFEVIKKQLNELSSVINSFKSEAVQLRIIELILGVVSEEERGAEERTVKNKVKKTKTKRIKKTTASKEGKKKLPPKPSGEGPVSTLINLYEKDFFKKPRTIGDIVQHCKDNLARQFKPNEFSGKLARMVRDIQLKRVKNQDNQYEYTNK
jgi:hypothetical protein